MKLIPEKAKPKKKSTKIINFKFKYYSNIFSLKKQWIYQ